MDGEKLMERKKMWGKPKWGKVKVNVDAAFNQKTKKAAICVIGRDWNGRFMGCICKRIEADSAFQAECYALLEAMNEVELWGSEGGELELDCAELIEKIRKRKLEGCEWGSADILRTCLNQLREERYMSWEVSLVSLEGNKAADLLAALTMASVVPQGWLNQSPTSLIQIMEKDREQAGQEALVKMGVG